MTSENNAKKVKIMQKENEEVAIEIIAQSIVDISDAIKKINAGRLKEKAVVLLIQKSSGVSQGDIISVLRSIENLKKDYVK